MPSLVDALRSNNQNDIRAPLYHKGAIANQNFPIEAVVALTRRLVAAAVKGT
jgi:hypothetical protein